MHPVSSSPAAIAPKGRRSAIMRHLHTVRNVAHQISERRLRPRGVKLIEVAYEYGLGSSPVRDREEALELFEPQHLRAVEQQHRVPGHLKISLPLLLAGSEALRSNARDCL